MYVCDSRPCLKETYVRTCWTENFVRQFNKLTEKNKRTCVRRQIDLKTEIRDNGLDEEVVHVGAVKKFDLKCSAYLILSLKLSRFDL